ncbi:MAG: ABC transporter permease, partial [Firmicutes bacterium]|nr:ABC transporter permease [Bacillota bacterium]
MNLLESFRLALDALRANAMRSFLTMLGVIIGVGAVIALMSIGRGAQEQIVSRIRGMGTNLLFITPGSISQGGVRSGQGQAPTLTLEDALAIADPSHVPRLRWLPQRSPRARRSHTDPTTRLRGSSAPRRSTRTCATGGLPTGNSSAASTWMPAPTSLCLGRMWRRRCLGMIQRQVQW